MGLIRCDWCPYKKENSGHRQATQMWLDREKTALYKPTREAWNRSFLHSPQNQPCRYRHLSSGHQNCDTINVYCLSPESGYFVLAALAYTPQQEDLLYLLAPLLLPLIDVEGQKDTTKKRDIVVYLSLQPCLLTSRLEYIQVLRQEGILGQSFSSTLPPGPRIFSSCEQYVSEEFLSVNNFTY